MAEFYGLRERHAPYRESGEHLILHDDPGVTGRTQFYARYQFGWGVFMRDVGVFPLGFSGDDEPNGAVAA